MSLPIEELTPREIVERLDQYIVGQAAAKRAVAVALRNRFRRQQVPRPDRDDIMPKNILLIGSTGVGKTEIARRLAQLARAPFVKVEATKFTEVGYVGRDVDSMIRELVAASVRLVEQEKRDELLPEAERRVTERLVDLLDPQYSRPYAVVYDENGNLVPQAEEEAPTDRAALGAEIQAGTHDARSVSIEVEEEGTSFLQVFTPGGMEEMGLDLPGMGGPLNSRRGWREMTVGEARAVLLEQEMKSALQRAGITKEAVARAEQSGIIFLDEIDKVASPKKRGSGPDVSREGVQRDLLPVIEGSTVQTKFGPVRTDHILFIAAGAFHVSKPNDLLPELQGRLPIRVHLESLGEADFRRILQEPKNSLTRQYEQLLSVEGVTVRFEATALDEMARIAQAANEKLGNIGARRLHTLVEKLLEPELFAAPNPGLREVTVTAALVRERLEPLLESPTADQAL